MKLTFQKSIEVPVSKEVLWNWHFRNGAFERLAPAWQKIELLDPMPELEAGMQFRFKIRKGPASLDWHAGIDSVDPCNRFIDTQLKGPFRSWKHEHRMDSVNDKSSSLTDDVSYSLPLQLERLSPLAGLADKELQKMFAFRQRRMLEDLERYSGNLPGEGRTVLITGATGLIGKRLVPLLRTLGYSIRSLTRGMQRGSAYHWDPETGQLDPAVFDGVDAVIHLAGENIAGGRWTENRKARLVQSRLKSTRLLVEMMAGLSSKPDVFISASGANFYGSGGGPRLETASAGEGFLADLCDRWEQEALGAEQHGIRTVIMRTGVVLDPLGGALGKMLPAFLFGVGGRVGTGQQAFPWIAMDDLLDVYVLAMMDQSLAGPVNAVHPGSVSQIEFSRTLARVLKRPCLIPLPEFIVKLLFGQMGEETLLADLNLVPGVLSAKAHSFRYDSLEDALSFMLGKVTS